MASFPPPPPPPGAYGPPPMATPPPRDRRQAGLIAGVIAVIVLVGGGVFLATRGDDDSTVQTDDSTDSTDAPDTSVTQPPSTTVPQTTVPPATTVALTLPSVVPATTTIPAVTPAGSADLGLGVSMPVPPGWTITDQGDSTTISDGTAKLTLQALTRTPGEDPAALLQEYVDTFDADYDAISYEPSIRYDRIDGALPIDQYGVSYSLLDTTAPDGIGVFGTAYVYIRADGLSVIYDIFSTEVTPGPGDESFNAFLDSLVAAPPLGDGIPLTERDTFRVTSVHEFVPVFGLAGYTLAPSFTLTTHADGTVAATTGDEDFEVQRLEAAGSLDAAVAAAQADNSAAFATAKYDPAELVDPNYHGLTRADVRWVTESGNELTGIITVYFDPATGNAYAIYRQWLGYQVAPHQSEAQFMFQSFAFSYTSI